MVVPQAIAAVAPALGGAVHRLAGQSMGTTWSVVFVAAPDCALEPVQRAVQAALDAVVAEMSPWLAGSAISRFNAAPADSWHVLPEDFFKVLACALQVADDSAGACDPCVGALVDAWGFGPARRHDEPGFGAPSAEAVAAALACSGWHRLQVDAATRSVRQPGGLRIDLSAIAKGFGVDQVVHSLRRRGIHDCLVEVGGELRGEGLKPDGQPWWVALETPPPHGLQAIDETLIALHGLSVATSGDYRRWFEAGGTRYSHTIDPRDGRPVRHGLASVTVLHRDCMAADALSTALNVMGAETGLVFARRHGLAALFVSRRVDGSFDEQASDALQALLQ